MKKSKLFTRNFTLLILGQASSLAGNYSLKFALSMYVLEQTGSAAVFAALLAASMIPGILLSPFGGMLADRVNRRNLMVALDGLSGLCVFMAVLLFGDRISIPLVGALLMILSVLGAFESPTVQACVSQMLSKENILKGNAAVNQVQAAASLITPFVGSVFYVSFGIRPVLLAASLCFFLTAALECMIRLERPRTSEKQTVWQIVRGDFCDSMSFLQKDQPQVLKLLFLAALASFFVVGIVAVGLPYLVRTVLGLSPEHYGAAESAMGLAAVFGGIGAGVLSERLRLGKLYWLMVILGLCLLPAGAVLFLPLGAFVKYLVVAVMFLIGQVSCCIFSVFSLTAIQQRTPENLTGKVMAYVMTVSMCAQPLGQFVYGLLFDSFREETGWVLILTGVVVCVIGLLSSGLFLRLEKTQ